MQRQNANPSELDRAPARGRRPRSGLWASASRVAVLAWAALWWVFSPSSAAAQEPADDSPGIEVAIDAAFSTYIVSPIATVLFLDVFFWDNTLPLGEGVGNYVEADGQRWVIAAYEEGKGYIYRPVKDAPAGGLVAKLDEPVERDVGKVTLHVTQEGSSLIGTPLHRPVDVNALGITLDVQATDRLRKVTAVAPVPVVVDIQNGEIVGFLPDDDNSEFAITEVEDEAAMRRRVELPPSVIPLSAGMHVIYEGTTWELRGVDGDQAELMGMDLRVDPEARINPNGVNMPLVVLWLVLGALFFTIRMGFINIRAFFHAIAVTTGRYDDPLDEGEISHFQALASALSATVGLGNIAGVAIAISAGGPGAVVWMVVAALLGMSSKFTECTLGQMYRVVKDDGTVSGGPMHYLDRGLEELGLGFLGKVLAVLFAFMCIGGSLGGGNMFQASQSFAAVADVVPLFEGRGWLYGLVLAALVAVVIIGGIRRIGAATSVIVPVMCGVYVLAGMWILAVNSAELPHAMTVMLEGAFTPEGVQGGILGVLVQGFKRASFSNEAGIGSASIAHSAASTSEPVREGIVALLEPFIDTVIVCTMTGLVVVVTGVYTSGDHDGVVMTSRAFATVFEWFPLVLSLAVVMFAFSTMISWSYYGERCATWLFGDRAALPYRVLFVGVVVLGAVIAPQSVVDFSDLMVLGMAFPNILGAVLLSTKVKDALDVYMGKLKRGEFARRAS